MSGIVYNQIRQILFTQDSERVHHAALSLAALAKAAPARQFLEFLFLLKDKRLQCTAAGLHFQNPVGLAAGFDKNAQAFDFFRALGFGHVELGTITAQPQSGNPKPRIFRLPDDRALINRMGFPSDGADKVAARLKARGRVSGDPILGINIGKTKVVSIDEAAADYCKSFATLEQYADYVTLNVSSPNTPELRKLQEPARLKELFRSIQELNLRKIPLFVKIAPDLTEGEVDEILDMVLGAGISGIIATNTTFSREGLKTQIEETGGLSGAPLTLRSRAMIQRLASKVQGKIALIGVGGIMCASDAKAMLDSGASLVQIYTGLVYEGPGFVREILRHLLAANEGEGW
jgi:dihydroorotate dehydrogenase